MRSAMMVLGLVAVFGCLTPEENRLGRERARAREAAAERAEEDKDFRRRHIREADPALVEGCHFIGTASGSSSRSGSAGRERARDEAAEKAADLKATHYVVFNSSQAGREIVVEVRAYRCTPSSATSSPTGVPASVVLPPPPSP